MSAEDWPALEETLGKVSTLTIHCKGLETDMDESCGSSSRSTHSSVESVDSGNDELSDGKLRIPSPDLPSEEHKWPMISGKKKELHQKRSGIEMCGADDLPLLERRNPSSKKSQSSGNGDGGSSISSDDVGDHQINSHGTTPKKKCRTYLLLEAKTPYKYSLSIYVSLFMI